MPDTATDPMARYAGFHPIWSVEKMRESLAKLAHLPDDTTVFLVLDDGNEADQYAPATELQVTHWNRYERCGVDDPDAEPAPFFIYPAERPSEAASEAAYHPIATLAALRKAVALLRYLPGDTIVLRTDDASNDEDPIHFAHDLQIARWDGQVQVEEGDDGFEDAATALFII